jgi:hypothetical protein
MGRFFNELLVRTCIPVHYRLESPRASRGADTFIHPRVSVPLVALLGKAPVGGRPYQRDDGMGSADDCYPGCGPTQIRRPPRQACLKPAVLTRSWGNGMVR